MKVWAQQCDAVVKRTIGISRGCFKFKNRCNKLKLTVTMTQTSNRIRIMMIRRVRIAISNLRLSERKTELL